MKDSAEKPGAQLDSEEVVRSLAVRSCASIALVAATEFSLFDARVLLSGFHHFQALDQLETELLRLLGGLCLSLSLLGLALTRSERTLRMHTCHLKRSRRARGTGGFGLGLSFYP